MTSRVVFETKCWEEDWSYMLNGGYRRKLQGFNNYNFLKKILYINNVNDPLTVCKNADRLVSQSLIDEWILVRDYEKIVLEAYNIERNSFIEEDRDGYYYSIAELVAIYTCPGDYIVHLAGDSNIELNNNYLWIDKAIQKMSIDKNILAANPVWNHLYKNAKDDAHGNEDEEWFYIPRFSDQCYLIDRNVFNNPIYNDRNERADFYFPKYGGNSFEKRVYAYLKNNNRLTLTSKHISYACPNH